MRAIGGLLLASHLAIRSFSADFSYVESWGDGVGLIPPDATNISVLAEGNFDLALRYDGTVVAWGPHAPPVPAGLSGIKAIAAGAFHCLAVKSNGTVVAWGPSISAAEWSVPVGLSNVVSVTAGPYHSVALKSDGTVTTWGNNNYGQLNVPPGLSNIVAISAGNYTTIALRVDGTVTGWGNGEGGLLDIPSNATNVVAIAFWQHGLALRGDGTVVGWGQNVYGQADAAFIENAIGVAVGAQHSVVLKSDGTVVSWGTPWPGMEVPEGLSGVVAVSARANHSTVLTRRPRIIMDPISLRLIPGASATFSVVAAGASALRYQWYRDDTAIGDATNATYGIGATTTNDTGFYSVVVSDDTGAWRRSARAGLTFATVTMSGGLSNGVALPGQAITLSIEGIGAPPLSYQWAKDGIDLPNATGNSLVLTNIQLADGGTYRVSVTTSNSTHHSELVLAVLSPPVITYQPMDTAVWIGDHLYGYFYITAGGAAPLHFQWFRNGVAIPFASEVNSGTSSYKVFGPDAGKTFQVVVTNVAGAVTSAPVVMYANYFDAMPPGVAVFEGEDATFSTSVRGGGPLRYQWLRHGVEIPGATNATFVLTNVTIADRGASQFSVICYNLGGQRQSPAVGLAVHRNIPAIVEQPEGRVVGIGEAVTLRVVVDAAPNTSLTYQWRRDGTNLAGATANSLSWAEIAQADAGDYHVIVDYGAGSITSSVAVLTVIDLPRIVQQPANVATNAGSEVTFEVVAAAMGSLSYQWFKNGAAIPSAVASTLVLHAVTSNDAAEYQVIVTNTANGLSATSSVARLTLHTVPVIVIQPVNVATRVFADAFFSAVATSATPVEYSWRKNGAALPGGDGSTLVFKNAQLADAGTYDLVAATPAGSVTSAPVELTVSSERIAGTIVGLNAPLVPLGLTNAVAISANYHLNAATRHDGSVVAWTDRVGAFLFGQSVSESITNVLSVVAGLSPGTAYALTQSGEVLNWMNGVATGLSDVSRILRTESIFLTAHRDGTVSGSPFLSQNISYVVDLAELQNGFAFLHRNGTVRISDLATGSLIIASNVVSIAGGRHFMMLRTDGRIEGGPLHGLTNIVAIAQQCCVALRGDGTVITENFSQPVTGAFAIAAAPSGHALVLTTNPPAPIVSASASSAGVIVSAPVSVSGYILESSANVLGPYSPVILAATNDFIFVPAESSGNQFFRLRKH